MLCMFFKAKELSMLSHCQTNIDRTFICMTYQSYPKMWGNIDNSSGKKIYKGEKEQSMEGRLLYC